MSAAVLELANLQVCYGKVQALHGVNLAVESGEIVALLGANGAGKSTTLRAISGLLRPRAGDIRYEGRSIAGLAADEVLRAGIAHCPEERHVWPEMTVEENLVLGAYVCRDRAEVRRRLDAVLDRFPRLRERWRQQAGTLSGGEQQMLAIGRSLMSAPSLLLLDEPTLGLSPKLADEVMEAVAEFRGRGVTVLLVEQNVQNALSVADRAYVFETGRVVRQDCAATLLDDPGVLRAYLGG